MRIDELDTPCLLLDLDRVNKNIATMMGLLQGTGVSLRPHFKTPKCPAVAELQMKAGAIGITVAKLGEAEVLADAGVGPILMANQVVGTKKIDRLMALLSRGVDIATAVESDFNIDELVAGMKRSGQRAAVVIEVDSGMRRCGSATPAETVRLARRLVDEGIDYRGIMGYEGHMYGQPEEAARTELITSALGTVNEHVEALAEAGLAPAIVSTSGTASVLIASRTPGVTELQAGTYVFNDLHTEPFIAGLFENALTLLLTVISVKERYAVGDAGLKSLSNDTGQSFSVDGNVKVARLSEEHCTLTGDGIANLKPGQRIEVVPSHGDTTLNMHDVYYVRRGDEIIDTWPIAAARKFR